MPGTGDSTHRFAGLDLLSETAPPDARAKELMQPFKEAIDLHARAFLFFECVAKVLQIAVGLHHVQLFVFGPLVRQLDDDAAVGERCARHQLGECGGDAVAAVEQQISRLEQMRVVLVKIKVALAVLQQCTTILGYVY